MQYAVPLLGEENIGQTPRIVIHIDFDYFYAQCEEVRNPSLKGKPLAVCVFSGRTEDSGVVSTANYVARSYDVRSGMPIKLAKSRLAGTPDAMFLSLDMPYYSEVSEKAMSLIQPFADKFEQIGIEECYLEVSNESSSIEEARTLGQQLKAIIMDAIGLTCSVGIAPNKLLAKIASDFQKPDGLTVVELHAAKSFLASLEVDKIPGIGPKTAGRLGELGVKKIGELAGLDQFKLAEEFGKKAAIFIYNAARGIDNEPVEDSGERKQIARILTLKNDATRGEEMAEELIELCRSVLKNARGRNLSFRTVSVFVVLNNLDQRSKSKSLKTFTSNFEAVHSTAAVLLRDLMASGNAMKVRRLGVRLSEFQNTSGQNTISQFMGG